MNMKLYHPVVASATLLVLIGAALSGAPLEAHAYAGGVVMTGTVVDEAGSPVEGLPLRLDIEHSPSFIAASGNPDIIPLDQLAATTTAKGGAFSFTLDHIPDFTPYLHEDSAVSLLVSTITEEFEVMRHFLAYPPAELGSAWMWQPDEASAEVPELGSQYEDVAGVVSETLGVLTFDLAHLADVQVTAHSDDGDVTAPMAEAPIATLNPSDTCPGMNYYYQRGSARTKVLDPIQRLYTLSKSSMKYEWTTSQNSRLEIAVKGAKGSYGGGLSKSRMNFSSGGMSPSFGNNSKVVIRAEWEYAPYYLYCDPWTTPTSYYSGVYEWRPEQWTTGSSNVANSNVFSCNSKWIVSMENPTWVAQESGVTWAGWFGIEGVSLRSSQKNSVKHKLTVTPNSGAKARICGRDNWPSKALQVREVA